MLIYKNIVAYLDETRLRPIYFHHIAVSVFSNANLNYLLNKSQLTFLYSNFQFLYLFSL